MPESPDYNLPFFSYGVFRPGEISFLSIKDLVEKVAPITIKGELVVRDGIPLFKDSGTFGVDGFLIWFKEGQGRFAYDIIDKLEPNRLFKWKMDTTTEGIKFNLLSGIKPDKGSVKHKEADWTSIWNDPLFTDAIELLEEIGVDDSHPEIKSLLMLQMKYMLLWTIVERFTFLRYSFGQDPGRRNLMLSEDIYFQEALKKYVRSRREVYSAKDPDNRCMLDRDSPRKSINYYYQVRSNITHRGKAVVKDFETVSFSFKELLDITKYILDKTRSECKKIRKYYEKR